jgi:hypothetical protein
MAQFVSKDDLVLSSKGCDVLQLDGLLPLSHESWMQRELRTRISARREYYLTIN